MTPLDAQAAALHAEALGLKAEKWRNEHGRWPEFGWMESVKDGTRLRLIARVGDECPAWVAQAVRFGERNKETVEQLQERIGLRMCVRFAECAEGRPHAPEDCPGDPNG